MTDESKLEKRPIDYCNGENLASVPETELRHWFNELENLKAENARVSGERSGLEILSKLYLELANVVPLDCISIREKKIKVELAKAYEIIRELIADKPWQNTPYELTDRAARLIGDK